MFSDHGFAPKFHSFIIIADNCAFEKGFWTFSLKFHTVFPQKKPTETPIGFAQCQLRRDYVEGTSTSPVGYLEGIYVCPEYRGAGLARALLSRCEAWAREQGCSEFASDCELTNTASLAFHQALGFTEANRIICFTKKL